MRRRKTAASMLSSAVTLAGVTAAHAHAPEHHVAGTSLTWSSDPLVIGLLALSLALYAGGFVRLASRSRAGARGLRLRAACFLAGMLMAVAALLSPIDTLGEELFSVHMLQHELLMLAVAPLLVASRPLAVFLWAWPSSARQWISAALCRGTPRRIWQVLHAPFAAWMLHALILWAWHFPWLFQASLASPSVHTLQHFSFLASALLFWSALSGTTGVAGRARAGSAVIYLLTTAIHTGMLGALLTFSPVIWYPAYLGTTHHWGLTPLEDQQLGGLVMWVPAGFLLLGTGLMAAYRLLGGATPTQAPAGR